MTPGGATEWYRQERNYTVSVRLFAIKADEAAYRPWRQN